MMPSSEALDRSLAAYDYELPPDRIAQTPVEPRDRARLLVVDGTAAHHHEFRDLPTLLQPGDLLVVNDTRVLPARLFGQKASGLPVEILLLEPQADPHHWLALVKPGRRLKPGTQIFFGAQTPPGQTAIDPHTAILQATVQATDPETRGRILTFHCPPAHSLETLLHQLGEVPLPPYITERTTDPERYQTVYGSQPGSAAAPTAGLHFTPDLLTRLDAAGIQRAQVTLHVGVGTFRPVESDDITAHHMHGERVEVPAATVEQIHRTKAAGGRVIAVGTTVVRSLEGASQTGQLQPFYGKTNLFIYPGYQWRTVDGLITNFHLPRSTLMMLVSALIGRERLLALYQLAIATGYRFYSFGDAMLILPQASHPAHRE